MDFNLKGCSLHEALAILEDDDDLEPRMLYIEPPDPAIDSDQDSGDEDKAGFINNLTGRQLSAGCEVVAVNRALSPRRTRSTSRRAPEVSHEAGPSHTPSRGSRPARGRSSSRRGRAGVGRNRGRGRNSQVCSNQQDSSSSENKSETDEPPAKKSKKDATSRKWVDEDLVRTKPIFPVGDYTLLRGNRIGIRGKKWWWPIFTYLVDAAICNAWVLSRQAGSTYSQLAFRREIVQTYLTRFKNTPRGGGRPRASISSTTANRVSDDIHYDGWHHLLVPSGSRLKCSLETCKSQTRLKCNKCNVGLCASCNYQFHVRM